MTATMTTQEMKAALVEQIVELLIPYVGTYPDPADTLPVMRELAREIIPTVREYDIDASAPWPPHQEMP